MEDAVVCFLTTGLHALVIGNFLVRKKSNSTDYVLQLCASLPGYSRLVETISTGLDGKLLRSHAITNTFSAETLPVSEAVFHHLRGSGQASVNAEELLLLWEKRAITLRPSRQFAIDDIENRGTGALHEEVPPGQHA